MNTYCERTLRRKANKVGYTIDKGFVHCLRVEGCPVHPYREVGYQVIDDATGFAVWDSFNNYYDHQWTLSEVERFLRDVYKSVGLAF